ncbi:MAG: heavy metal translocating P-type ATPase [Candidatus Accumulibacter sp.]|jgi:Cd2+/Zn2+-exporting ATPase|nr:heavy metal translocating P-type ATPase [Accumulibacter sp.]
MNAENILNPVSAGGACGGCACAGKRHGKAETVQAAQTAEPTDIHSSRRVVLRIPNMDCPVEEALIRKKFSGMDGVTGLSFNLLQRALTVEHNLPSTESIVAALRSIGMLPEEIDADERREPVSDAKIPWGRLGAALFLAALSEVFEFARGFSFGLDPQILNVGGIALPAALSVLFAIAAVALGGLDTYKKGWIAVKNRNLDINALMSVAVTGALFIGQYPEAAMVMALFNLAEAIEAKALDRARKAIGELLSLAPETATVKSTEGAWVETDARRVSVGDTARVKPGERIPLDGVVTRGASAVNQAPITGEAMPVEKGVGDTVYAGTINETGSFEFEVTATAANSTLARIIHAVEEAQGTRAPMQRFVESFAKYYTPAVFLVAFLTAVVPPLLMGLAWNESIYTALVLLVVGCPCALVISTPVAIVSGMTAAARHGILIKGGVFLEQGRLLECLALDKTGTLTHGRPVLTDSVAVGDLDAERAFALAASLAARSDHPVSRAIAEHAAARGVALYDVDAFTAIPGQGVSGVIEGRQWRLGNRRTFEAIETPAGDLGASSEVEKNFLRLESQGKTVVALVGDRVQGLFAVADALKDSSIEAIVELKALGVKTIMLTGDNEHTARVVAERSGVDDFRAALLPEDKLKIVENLASKTRVGMAGDGINDAPALAGAHIGFAMAGGGSDAAVETADVALIDDDLRKIPRFIRLSRATHAVLVQNLVFALGVKAAFFALTFTGHATMWMAVFADVGTSLLVVANGLGIRRQETGDR